MTTKIIIGFVILFQNCLLTSQTVHGTFHFTFCSGVISVTDMSANFGLIESSTAISRAMTAVRPNLNSNSKQHHPTKLSSKLNKLFQCGKQQFNFYSSSLRKLRSISPPAREEKFHNVRVRSLRPSKWNRKCFGCFIPNFCGK